MEAVFLPATQRKHLSIRHCDPPRFTSSVPCWCALGRQSPLGLQGPSHSPGDRDRNSQSSWQRGMSMKDMAPEMLAGGFVSPESGEKQSHGKKNDKNSLLPHPLRLSPVVTKQLLLDLSVSLLSFGSQVKSLKCLEGWNSYFTFCLSGEGAPGARVPWGHPASLMEGSVWAQIPAGLSKGTRVFAPLHLAPGSGREQTGSEGAEQVPAIAAASSSPNIRSALSPLQPAHTSLPRGSAAQAPAGRPCSTGAVCPSATTPTARRCLKGCRERAWDRSMPA